MSDPTGRVPGGVPAGALGGARGRVPGPRREYLIDHLAQAAGTTVRNVRAYQDRGLLPRVDRRGRANVYDDAHLERLRLIAGLLDRGHTLAGIKELLDAWEDGRSLAGVLGLVAEVTAPWSDERPERLDQADLAARFGGLRDPEAIAAAVRLGVLEPEPAPEQKRSRERAHSPGEPAVRYRVPSPALLDAAVRLFELGVPLSVSIAHLQEVRSAVQHLAHRFVRFAAVEVFPRHVGSAPLDDVDAAVATEAVRRLRPLARAVVDAELARAMRNEARLLLEASVAALPDPVREVVAAEER